MNRFWISRTLYGLLAGLLLFVLSASSSAEILKIVVQDTIQPITAEYVERALDEAAQNKDQALLIEINTPGGLLISTRKIIEKILASPVPVIIYVTPSGSWAASAASTFWPVPTWRRWPQVRTLAPVIP